MLVRLQKDPIRVEEALDAVRSGADGAVTLFLGTVRDHHRGRRVRRLDYHAYPEMAESEMSKVAATARDRYGVSGVALIHRTGQLEIGEIAVAVAVASPHRAQAFDACRFIIDSLKRTVPIWKKEFFDGGEAWIGEGS